MLAAVTVLRVIVEGVDDGGFFVIEGEKLGRVGEGRRCGRRQLGFGREGQSVASL